MVQTSIERDILALERQYWQAIKERDVEGALALTDDPCLIAGASGVGKVDHQSFTKIMASAQYTLLGFEIGEAEVRKVTEDVAVLAYKVREDLTVDGKPVTLNAADTSVWVQRGGRWLCAMHTESVLGDAYGRDRTAEK
jgi:ketosteroid isomerase-like protein